MSSIGIAIGIVVAAMATRPMHALLFGVTPLDPIIYVDPAVALRSD